MTLPPWNPYQYTGHALRVIDGDTYHLRLDLGFHVRMDIPCRLRGVDTPELTTEAGKAVRAVLVDWLRPGPDALTSTAMLIQSYRDRQSFARWIVDAWVPDADSGEWQSLAARIIDAGHGVAA
jgi:endonuclease YncB( thermonuclease family)